MRRALPWVVALLGGALVAAGGAVFAVANRSTAPDFGWTAYAPLQTEVPRPYSSGLVLSFDGWTVLWTAGHLVGVLLAVLGLLLLSGLTGWLLGRRGSHRAAAPG